MGELPKGWIKSKLGDLLKLKNGFAFKSKDYSETGIPIIRMSDILNGEIVLDKAAHVEELDEYERYVINKGDLLIGMSGSIGKFGIYTRDEKVYLNQRVGNLKLFSDDLIDKRFIYYLVGNIQKKIVEKAYGGTVPNISAKDIEGTEILLPPLGEQKRMVAKLDVLFGELEVLKGHLENIPELLKNFRQAVLTQAVTGKLTAEWRVGKNLGDVEEWVKNIVEERSNLGLLKKTKGLVYENVEGKPFEEPESWTFAYLQNFGELTRGKSKHRPRNDAKLFGGDYPFIQTGDVAQSGGLITDYKTSYSEFGLAQSRLFPKGTLCITIAANIAETGILDFDACFPDSVVGYLPYGEFYSADFAMFYLKVIQQDLEQYAPATAQKNINLGILFEVPFPVPPKEEQEEIVRRVEGLFARANAIETKYKALKDYITKLPQAILAKAFRGELVEQLPTDGDAKELLEEIKKLKEQLALEKKNTGKKTRVK